MKPATRDEKLPTLAPIAGVVTSHQISKELHINVENTRALRAHIVVSSVVTGAGGTLTAKFMGRINPSADFANFGSANSSTTFSADGTVILKLSDKIAADAVDVPFFPHVILAVTTDHADATITVDKIWFEYL